MDENMITLEKAQNILHSRGIDIDLNWLRKKARDGKIDGAYKIGDKYRGTWFIPKEWAMNYEKDTRGRKRADNQ